MATTTVSGSTVTFSNSGAAANLSQTGTEDGTLAFTFDVLAASGGGKNTTIYSVDDGAVDTVYSGALSNNFKTYDTDLLVKDDSVSSWQLGGDVSDKGAHVWIGDDNKIHYDASNLNSQIQALGQGEVFTDTVKYTIKMSNGTLSVGTLTVVINGAEDEASGTLTISGTVEEGASISADTNALSDVDGGISNIAYQWQIDTGSGWINIGGATSANLSIPSDQSYVGAQVRVTAITTDAFGGTTSFASAAQTVANVEDEASGTLTISGTVEEGASISADTNALSDVDGGISNIAYQWQIDTGSGWINIGGATSANLSIPSDQSYVGAQVRVTAITTDAFGGTTSFASAAQTVANVEDEASGTLTISGTVEEGASISADTNALSDVDGGISNIAYQWQIDTGSGWINIGGATSANLSIPSDQSYVGAQVRVTAITTDAFGGTTSFASAAQTVANVNDNPTDIALTDNSVAEHASIGTVVGTLSTTDVDDLSHTYTILPGGTGNGLFTIVGNEIRVAATLELSPEVNTVYTLDIQTDDGHGGLHNEVFNITITNDLSDDVVIATLPATFTGTGDPNDNDAAGSGVSTSAGAGEGGTVSDGNGAGILAGSDFGETFNAGNGNDTVYGRGGNDTINGQGGADTSLYGQAGDDLINGGAAGDTIYGGSGNDTIYGMQNPETPSPSDAGDTIFGGSGSDAIHGQAGDDTIIGGFGADILTGGFGADTFEYLSLLDTGDTITDFSTVQSDKIDLSAIDANPSLANDQAFAWGGQQTDQCVQAHSVTWFQSGSNVVVLADTDGNLTTAEFSMTLTGISSLNQNDFLL